MRILITGSSGFIGNNLVKFLSNYDYELFTLDLVDNGHTDFICDITDNKKIDDIFREYRFDKVIHLAASAGVRQSLSEPYKYIRNNVIGFQSILESCVKNDVKQLIYASSSSVYGNLSGCDEKTKCDEQLSVYAVTKKENENMAYVYSHNYNLKTTGLRFFSVFGDGIRKDLAIYKFVDNIINDKELEVYGDGTQERDYTPVRYICEYIKYFIDNEQETDYEIYNIGSQHPISVNELINTISEITQIQPKVVYLQENKQDVKRTYADDSKIRQLYIPKPITFKEGLGEYIKNKVKN